VFLAEDEPVFRRVVGDALRDGGFDVLSASSGHEMLALLTAASRGEVQEPDAIVMDVRMPRCSGLDVLGALRLADWRQPVIMMTGFGDPELHERAAAYGASVILDKPFEADDLVSMIDLLLRLAHADVMRDAARMAAGPEDDAPETLRSPPSAA
jgi:CheY-like chemotaxis protein